jgi:hypothetical protein
MEFPDGDFYVHAEVIFTAKNFCDSASRALSCARPICYFYIDDNAFEIRPVGVASGFFA